MGPCSGCGLRICRLSAAVTLLIASPVLGVGTIRQITANGAWTPWSDPRALYDDGKIVTGWVTSGGDIVFGSHDLAAGQTTTLTMSPAYERDDHDNPVFVKNPDGTFT